MKNYHIILLQKLLLAAWNLYRLVSLSPLAVFWKAKAAPCMTKDSLKQYRDDIIIGSACAAGEVYRAILSGSNTKLLQIADFMITANPALRK